ncbi:sporulation protein RMD1 [Xylariaceae sp. FL0255]|nr:sporulation protein RMD1 [Xylariaceae sp. FL0255]
MAFKKHGRAYDVVVFGATGYTGLMVAEFITAQFPTNTKWAIAGRSAEKLQDVIKTCNSINSDREPPQIEICNLNDRDLIALAKKTFVLITTVGPYHLYGEHAFKACAENGTHYIDCTGEAVWHMEMIKKYGEKAKASGACMFPQAGIESGPPDLVTFSLASAIRENLSAKTGDVVITLHDIHAAPSGGTLATALGLFENYSLKAIKESHTPYAMSPISNPKKAPRPSILSLLSGSHQIPVLGLAAPSITSGTDTAVVQRSWGLLQTEPALKEVSYGPNFTYREYMKTRNVVTAMFAQYTLLFSGLILAFVPPIRSLLKRFIFKPGQGPARESTSSDYIEYRGVATPDTNPATKQRAFSRAWYRGSIYFFFSRRSHMPAMASTPASSNATSGERTPLLRQDTARPRSSRNVTFNANPVSRTIEPPSLSSSPGSTILDYAQTTGSFPPAGTAPAGGGPNAHSTPPMLSALNSRLRRRNSHGAVFTALPPAVIPKQGPQRSSKNAQKLKLLPAPEVTGEDGGEAYDEESGRDVYSQYTRIKDPMARRDAARLGKADRERLPRVTAYCTANKYQTEGLMRFLKTRAKTRGANPKLIDECIYSPYSYGTGRAGNAERVEAVREFDSRPVHAHERRHSDSEIVESQHIAYPGQQQDPEAFGGHVDTQAALGGHASSYSNTGRDEHNDLSYPEHSHLHSLSHSHSHHTSSSSSLIHHQHEAVDADFDTQVHTPEVFLFDYGVVVIWGMSPAHEQRFLKDIAKFEIEKLDADDVETECFNFYYTREYQARIYNDFITLRDKGNYMTKLAISHALAQSVKTSLFEELIASTVDACKDIPTQIALTGKIALSRSQINMQIGELFILRINIHLNGSVLDTPELFWVEPHLEPVYQAVRSYLEMDQRVGLLTERLDVIADLLAVLKDQLSHGHGEMLEWIVIILIAAEILVAAVNIIVDLYAGVD